MLGDPEQQQNGDYGTEEASSKTEQDDKDFVTLKERGWSFQESRRAIATASIRPTKGNESTDDSSNEEQKGLQFYLYCIIYALVNVIISAPGCT